MQLKVSDLISVCNQPSLTVLVNANPSTSLTTTLNSLVQSVQTNLASLSSPPSTNLDSKVVYLVNQSDSIIHTLLSLLSKKDLINEHSSKYLVQYFQFFNYYLSLGIQQVFFLNKFLFFVIIR